MDNEDDKLISADGDSDGSGDETKTIDPDLLDEMDDAELEDDLEEEAVVDPNSSDDDDEEDDEGYGLDGDDQ